MGVDLVWQNEHGVPIERIGDPQMLLPTLMFNVPLNGYICLRFLDPYGDTYFNQYQIPVLLDELIKVRSTITDDQFEYYRDKRHLVLTKIQAHLDQVIELVRRSNGQIHTYLRFVGD